jgi:hypothetical protein
MNIEAIGLAGCISGAAALAAFFYRRRQDVLHGPYIEGVAARTSLHILRNECGRLLSHVQIIVARKTARLRWKARDVIYIASVVAC